MINPGPFSDSVVSPDSSSGSPGVRSQLLPSGLPSSAEQGAGGVSGLKFAPPVFETGGAFSFRPS